MELQGTVENRSLLVGGVAFDILWCWKDDHLQTSEYSLQNKYKGGVTNTTDNVDLAAVLRSERGVMQNDFKFMYNQSNKNVVSVPAPANEPETAPVHFILQIENFAPHAIYF